MALYGSRNSTWRTTDFHHLIDQTHRTGHSRTSWTEGRWLSNHDTVFCVAPRQSYFEETLNCVEITSSHKRNSTVSERLRIGCSNELDAPGIDGHSGTKKG